MRVLFDQGVPIPLRHIIASHAIDTAYERGWSNFQNGALLDAAESDGYQVFLTTDQQLQHQQNINDRTIAIIVLQSTDWPRIRTKVDLIQQALDAVTAGAYGEIPI
jgi:hypothetical protein